MRLNRNHYFLAGTVVLLLGIQFRTVDSYLLNKEARDVVTKIWQKAQAKKQEQKPSSVIPVTFFSQPPAALLPKQHKIKPPRWIGWVLVSVGAIFVLHSLAMSKPG